MIISTKLQKKLIGLLVALCILMSSSSLAFAANAELPRIFSVETITSDGELDDYGCLGAP